MKPSHFAAIVFIVIGVFGVWKIMQYKRLAEARSAVAADAGADAAPRQ